MCIFQAFKLKPLKSSFILCICSRPAFW